MVTYSDGGSEIFLVIEGLLLLFEVFEVAGTVVVLEVFS